ASCSASGDPGTGGGGRLNQVGSGSSSASAGTGNIITSPNTGPNGATGNITTNNGGGSNATDAGCQHVEVNFVPKIPTVFVLVDRSNSMFTPDNKTQVVSWDPLKAGVLSVVKQLEGQVRFGFGAVTGQQDGMCPIFSSIAPALNNASAITSLYQPLGKVAGAEGQTPVIMVLPLLKALLDQPGNDGDKYVLFVTDGEPDFCDNGDAKCAVDAVVAGVQKLAAEGIHTIVFGLKSSISDISGETLQAIANAGASLPAPTPFGATNKEQDVCYACKGVPPWVAQWPQGMLPDPNCMTTGAQTLGKYGAATTNATVYHPDPADQSALTAQIASVVSGIKSCTFDLGGDISVDLNQLEQASVAIEGQKLPLAQDNGWRMNSPTQVELVGSGCAAWNDPKNTHIDFNFPCDIIVVK
ncbi:MAG TPA: hypothetical protein VGC79_09585, partial [Polyangiaceae bacterium]